MRDTWQSSAFKEAIVNPRERGRASAQWVWNRGLRRLQRPRNSQPLPNSQLARWSESMARQEPSSSNSAAQRAWAPKRPRYPTRGPTSAASARQAFPRSRSHSRTGISAAPRRCWHPISRSGRPGSTPCAPARTGFPISGRPSEPFGPADVSRSDASSCGQLASSSWRRSWPGLRWPARRRPQRARMQTSVLRRLAAISSICPSGSTLEDGPALLHPASLPSLSTFGRATQAASRIRGPNEQRVNGR